MTTWAWQTVVSQGLLGDKTALAAHLDQLEAEACAAALEAGYALGLRSAVRMHPQVWVDRWDKDGGAYVAPAIARMAGVVGTPAGALVLFEWPVVDQAELLAEPAQLGPAAELPGPPESDHRVRGLPAIAPARGFVAESGL